MSGPLTSRKVTQAKPEYSGFCNLGTKLSPEHAFHSSLASLVGHGMYMAMGENRQLLAVLLGDGSYHIGIGLRLPETWSSEHAALLNDPSSLRKHLVQEHFADWPQVHTDFITKSDGSFRAWPLYAMPKESLSWKTVPGIALVGDAAHLT